MNAFRRNITLRLLATVLLGSLVSAMVAPAVSARTGASSRVYAEWMKERIPGELPLALRLVLVEAAEAPYMSLEAFVDDVVRTLVREEGLAWTSNALTGTVLDSISDVREHLLGGLQSLGPGALPAGALSARHDAPRATAQRADALVVRWMLNLAISTNGNRGASERLDDQRPAPEPGRGDVQPLGP